MAASLRELQTHLTNFVNQHRLGEIFPADTGFILGRNPDTVRAPDVAFVRADRMSTVAETDGYCPGAPDLAVEVVSPGNSLHEIEKKSVNICRWRPSRLGCKPQSAQLQSTAPTVDPIVLHQ